MEKLEGQFAMTISLLGHDMPVTIDYEGHMDEGHLEYDEIGVMLEVLGVHNTWEKVRNVSTCQVADFVDDKTFKEIEERVYADLRQQYDR